MKEVRLNRVSGPFKGIPYENYIQSPIGLVPKQQEDETRLIFYLSYPPGDSLNSNTPKELCSVKYSDFHDAIRLALDLGKFEPNHVFLGKSDLMSAFRNLPIRSYDRRWLVMKARHPKSGKIFYFVDKCLPFGASISCSHFSRVSNSLAHIYRFLTNHNLVAYLDDFLFGEIGKNNCDNQVKTFMEICNSINFPVSLDKTILGSQEIVFLGILINTRTRTISIPTEKRDRALQEIDTITRAKKVKVLQVQQLTGLLNFICRAIFPGRAFTRRFYAKISGGNLKQHHHIRVDQEMREGLLVWRTFLNGDNSYCRPFVDFSIGLNSEELKWFTDSSAGIRGGLGLFFDGRYSHGLWGADFIRTFDPSIAFLELYALACSIELWAHLVSNKRVTIFCDNESVVTMVNNSTSGCHLCMKLIRMITLTSLKYNVRFFAKHIEGKTNVYADLLSRNKIKRFLQLAGQEVTFTQLPQTLGPVNINWWKSN